MKMKINKTQQKTKSTLLLKCSTQREEPEVFRFYKLRTHEVNLAPCSVFDFKKTPRFEAKYLGVDKSNLYKSK